MKQIDVGQALNTVANIGVIVGIVFLAIEINQTNKAVAGSAYQARALAMMQRQDMFAESDNLAPLLAGINAEERGTATESVDRQRLYSTSLGAFMRVDGVFYQYELGLLDEEYYCTIFAAEMRLWMPRWATYGIVDEQLERGFVRPSMKAEIDKYYAGAFDDMEC